MHGFKMAFYYSKEKEKCFMHVGKHHSSLNPTITQNVSYKGANLAETSSWRNVSNLQNCAQVFMVYTRQFQSGQKHLCSSYLESYVTTEAMENKLCWQLCWQLISDISHVLKGRLPYQSLYKVTILKRIFSVSYHRLVVLNIRKYVVVVS